MERLTATQIVCRISDLKAGSLRMTEVNKLATVPADMVAFDAFMTMHKVRLCSAFLNPVGCRNV